MTGSKSADFPSLAKGRPMKSSETPGCSAGCAYAYSCHEFRMGRPGAVFWPGIGIVLPLAIGAMF